MANSNPKVEHLKAYQNKPKYGDRPLSRKVVGTRYPEDVYDALQQMTNVERQQFIREAVAEKLAGVQPVATAQPDDH